MKEEYSLTLNCTANGCIAHRNCWTILEFMVLLALTMSCSCHRTSAHSVIYVVFLFYSGVLGEPGSSSFMFEHKGMVRVPREELSSSATKMQYSDPLELAIDVGAEDVISNGEEGGSDDECYQLKCEPNHLKAVSDAVKEKGFSVSSETLEYIPKSYVSLDHQAYDKATKLVDLLSSHADVMEVYDNFSLQGS